MTSVSPDSSTSSSSSVSPLVSLLLSLELNRKSSSWQKLEDRNHPSTHANTAQSNDPKSARNPSDSADSPESVSLSHSAPFHPQAEAAENALRQFLQSSLSPRQLASLSLSAPFPTASLLHYGGLDCSLFLLYFLSRFREFSSANALFIALQRERQEWSQMERQIFLRSAVKSSELQEISHFLIADSGLLYPAPGSPSPGPVSREKLIVLLSLCPGLSVLKSHLTHCRTHKLRVYELSTLNFLLFSLEQRRIKDKRNRREMRKFFLANGLNEFQVENAAQALFASPNSPFFCGSFLAPFLVMEMNDSQAQDSTSSGMLDLEREADPWGDPDESESPDPLVPLLAQRFARRRRTLIHSLQSLLDPESELRYLHFPRDPRSTPFNVSEPSSFDRVPKFHQNPLGLLFAPEFDGLIASIFEYAAQNGGSTVGDVRWILSAIGRNQPTLASTSSSDTANAIMRSVSPVPVSPSVRSLWLCDLMRFFALHLPNFTSTRQGLMDFLFSPRQEILKDNLRSELSANRLNQLLRAIPLRILFVSAPSSHSTNTKNAAGSPHSPLIPLPILPDSILDYVQTFSHSQQRFDSWSALFHSLQFLAQMRQKWRDTEIQSIRRLLITNSPAFTFEINNDTVPDEELEVLLEFGHGLKMTEFHLGRIFSVVAASMDSTSSIAESQRLERFSSLFSLIRQLEMTQKQSKLMKQLIPLHCRLPAARLQQVIGAMKKQEMSVFQEALEDGEAIKYLSLNDPSNPSALPSEASERAVGAAIWQLESRSFPLSNAWGARAALLAMGTELRAFHAKTIKLRNISSRLTNSSASSQPVSAPSSGSPDPSAILDPLLNSLPFDRLVPPTEIRSLSHSQCVKYLMKSLLMSECQPLDAEEIVKHWREKERQWRIMGNTNDMTAQDPATAYSSAAGLEAVNAAYPFPSLHHLGRFLLSTQPSYHPEPEIEADQTASNMPQQNPAPAQSPFPSPRNASKGKSKAPNSPSSDHSPWSLWVTARNWTSEWTQKEIPIRWGTQLKEMERKWMEIEREKEISREKKEQENSNSNANGSSGKSATAGAKSGDANAKSPINRSPSLPDANNKANPADKSTAGPASAQAAPSLLLLRKIEMVAQKLLAANLFQISNAAPDSLRSAVQKLRDANAVSSALAAQQRDYQRFITRNPADKSKFTMRSLFPLRSAPAQGQFASWEAFFELIEENQRLLRDCATEMERSVDLLREIEGSREEIVSMNGAVFAAGPGSPRSPVSSSSSVGGEKDNNSPSPRSTSSPSPTAADSAAVPFSVRGFSSESPSFWFDSSGRLKRFHSSELINYWFDSSSYEERDYTATYQAFATAAAKNGRKYY